MKKSIIFTFLFLIIIVVDVQFANAQSIRNNNNSIVLNLPFNGNIIDESGNGYIVTNNGATLSPDRFGTPNSAYYFDRNDYMTIPIEQNMPNVNEDGYTVSFWVKQDTSAADGGYMMSYGYWNGGGGFTVQYKAGTSSSENYSVAINKESGSTSLYFNRYNIFSYGWNMITFSYKNGVLKGYINGSFVEETAAELYSNPGHDFVIGNKHNHSNGVTAWFDDVIIYNRALSNLEIAHLSGLSGAIRAEELHAYNLTDFELGAPEPVKLTGGWGTAGSGDINYVKVIENPVKNSDNPSDYIMTAVTFPTCITDLFGCPSMKWEYYTHTKDGGMNDRHVIVQWKAMYPDSAIVKVDSMRWLTQNQIHGQFEMFQPPCAGLGQIAGGTGGIFNENSIETHGEYTNKDTRLDFRFFYRALPDSQNVWYTMDIGKWVTFTYDIFWTKSDTGYWRLYKDGELLSYRDNVVTVPECAPDGSTFWMKTGMYTRWNDYVDNEIDSISFYFDDIELYVDPEENDINIYDICPECYTITSNQKLQNTSNSIIYPNPVKDILNIKGNPTPSSITVYTYDGRQISRSLNTNTINLSHLKQGIYIAVINLNGTLVTKKIIKE